MDDSDYAHMGITSWTQWIKKRHKFGKETWRGLGELGGEETGRYYENALYTYMRFSKNKLKIFQKYYSQKEFKLYILPDSF